MAKEILNQETQEQEFSPESHDSEQEAIETVEEGSDDDDDEEDDNSWMDLLEEGSIELHKPKKKKKPVSQEEIEAEEEGSEEEEEEGEEGSEEEGSDEEEEEGSEEEGSEEEEEEGAGELPEWTQGIRDAFPDREFNSMDDFDQANIEWHQQKDNEISQFRQNEQAIVDKLNNDPDAMAFFRAFMDGKPFRVALIESGIDSDTFNIQETDEDAEAIVEARINRKNAAKKEQERQAELQSNQQESEQTIRKWQDKKGLKDSAREQFVNQIASHIQNIVNMKWTEADLDMYYKAWKYDTDVEDAKITGRINGRNERIKVEKKKRNGDGVARLSSAQTKSQSRKVEYDSPITEMIDKLPNIKDY